MKRRALALAVLTACASDYDLPRARQCAIDRPPPADLHVEGARIVDEHGRVVLLRGVNAGGRSKFAPYRPFDGDDFDADLAAYLDRPEAWGFDVLRVPFSWAAWETSPGTWDDAWLARYDALLDAAWERGMYTIVDFHQDVYAEPFCGDGFPAWTLDDPGEPRHDCPNWFTRYVTDDAVREAFARFWTDETGVRTAFVAMWQRMAAHQAGRPGVLGFEILNEPHGGSLPAEPWERDTLGPFYGELAAAVQAMDPDALVLFDVPGIAATSLQTALVPPVGDGLVFAPHLYDPGALFDFPLGMDVGAAIATWSAQGEEWSVPTLLGELGIDAAHEAVFDHAAAHYDALDAHWMHATWWEYSDASELWNGEDLSLVGPDGDERTAMLDAVVRPYASAVAGEPLTQSFDYEERAYSLSFSPLDGVSEVRLPERVYGDVRVGARGACVRRDGPLLLVRATGDDDVQLSVHPR